MTNNDMMTFVAIILTVVLVMILVAVAVYLLSSAANDRRQTQLDRRERRAAADRQAFNQWTTYYREEIQDLRARLAGAEGKSEEDKRLIRRLEKQLETAYKLDAQRVERITALEAKLKALEA